MTPLCLRHPVFLDHFEEHMRAQDDLNLVESIRRCSHTDHVAEAVSKRILLHLEVQTIGHLNQGLDGDRLQTELHDHHVVHESVERNGGAILYRVCFLFDVDPDLFLHNVVHELVDFVRDHRDLEILQHLFVFLCTEL